MEYIIYPSAVSIFLFVIFLFLLKRQIGEDLFGEIGFLYLGLTMAYTIMPAVAFIYSSDDGGPLEKLLPTPYEFGIHLWRHVLFIFGVSSGYLLFRGKKKVNQAQISLAKIDYSKSIIFFIVLISICIVVLTLASDKVDSYYDNFSRYDYLPWLPRKLVSLFLRLKVGFYSVLITLLFLNYKKYRLIIPIVVTAICAYEIIYSKGARIFALMILLQTLCLYCYTVKMITLKQGAIAVLCLGILFSAIELIRIMDFDLSKAQSSVSEDGLKSASELGSVYFPGYHLYSERAKGQLPPADWEMFFNDFISIFTFGDFTKWTPMEWYYQNYFPDAPVAPFTLGPIADSAIWGGEIDLFFRSLINGIFFAFIVKWFIRNSHKWWAIVIYTYCYATCVMTLKYSVFYHLTPLVKTVFPVILIAVLVKKIMKKKNKLIQGDNISS